jgi:ABC-type histidine transport system ATPase subunit
MAATITMAASYTTPRGTTPAPDRSDDPRQVALGGRQQRIALAPALAGKIRVTAHDEALVRPVGASDLRHVPLVEERGLQRPAGLGQGLDLRRAGW